MINSVRQCFLIAVAATIGCVIPAVTCGCSCAEFTVADSYGNADYVFQGVVTARVVPEPQPVEFASGELAVAPGTDMVRYVVVVSNVWKGEVASSEVVYSRGESAACGVVMEIGGEYLFYCRHFDSEDFDDMPSFVMWGGEPKFPVKTTSMCSGTKDISRLEEDLEYLEVSSKRGDSVDE